jgi:hypothetical protein
MAKHCTERITLFQKINKLFVHPASDLFADIIAAADLQPKPLLAISAAGIV